MNRWQKIAWFNLAVMILMLVICSIMAMGMPLKDAITPPSPLTLVIVPALILTAMSSTVIFRKRPQEVDYDERDSQIHRRCKYAGWIAFSASLFIGLWICYISVGPKGSLYPLVLPTLAFIGAVIYIIVSSVAALIQYGRGGNTNG